MLAHAHDVSMIRYSASMIQGGSATTSSSYCIRDESGWIRMNRGVSDILIYHEYTYGAPKNEPDSAMAELRFRPCLQSTTIHPKGFKRFKIVIALSWRFRNHQDSS